MHRSVHDCVGLRPQRCFTLRGEVHLTEEALEHQQRPERLAVISAAGGMAIDEARDRANIEKATIAHLFAGEGQTQAVRAQTSELARERGRKALLGAVKILAGHIGLERPLQDVFPLALVQPKIARQGRRPLDQHVIEEGNARLERGRHARAVDLGQDVAGEIGLDVDVLRTRDWIVRAGLPHVAGDELGGVVIPHSRAHLR